MIKKVIIFLFLFAFLSSVITPNFALAEYHTEPISVGTALAISAGALVVIFGIWYLVEKNKTEKIEKVSLFNQTVQKSISSSGEIVLLRF
jgi:hypothetical protein